MTEWAQVNLRVSPEQKTEWEKYVKSHPDVNNLSHLVRLAVTREIQDSDEPPVVQETGVPSEVLESLTRIENAVTDIQTRVGALEREQHAESGIDYQRAVLSVLPAAPKGKVVTDPDGKKVRLDRTEDPDEFAMTVEEVAEALGTENVDSVRRALDTLYDLTAQVRRQYGGDDAEFYYWRPE